MSVQQTTNGKAPKITRRRRYATLYRQAFPQLQNVPARYRFKLSRIRNETSASPSEEIVELWRSQVGVCGAAERAALLLEDLADQYDAIFGEPDADLLDAFFREQQHDGEEDAVQLRAANCLSHLHAWVDRSRTHAASARVARAVAIRKMEAR